MTPLDQGTRAYDVGVTGAAAEGWELEDSAVVEGLSGRVATAVVDPDDIADLLAPLDGLDGTGFDPDIVRTVCQQEVPVYWRIGEIFATCYLEDQCECLFPWNSDKDLRHPRTSAGGNDLVGYDRGSDSVRFAFGEVKTSSEDNAPPSVMYGAHGMVGQLESLRSDPSRMHLLVRYLGVRYRGQPWERIHKDAFRHYVQDADAGTVLIGVLVRTTPANPDDLRSRAQQLANGAPPAARLLALYLPVSSDDWSAHVSAGMGSEEEE